MKSSKPRGLIHFEASIYFIYILFSNRREYFEGTFICFHGAVGWGGGRLNIAV